jgi:predicted O-linked N-acetylglucosamine transferase (SPINDLY family)
MSCADLAFLQRQHHDERRSMGKGLLVLTMRGRHFASRVSLCLLLAMNLFELITASPTEYLAGA